jgi:hypothetical protein
MPTVPPDGAGVVAGAVVCAWASASEAVSTSAVMRSLIQPLVLEEKMRLDARSFFHSCLISEDFDPPPGHLLGPRAHERPMNKAAHHCTTEELPPQLLPLLKKLDQELPEEQDQ